MRHPPSTDLHLPPTPIFHALPGPALLLLPSGQPHTLHLDSRQHASCRISCRAAHPHHAAVLPTGPRPPHARLGLRSAVAAGQPGQQRQQERGGQAFGRTGLPGRRAGRAGRRGGRRADEPDSGRERPTGRPGCRGGREQAAQVRSGRHRHARA